MDMMYFFEILHHGKLIEQRHSDVPFPDVQPGEQIYVEAGDLDISEDHGVWWIVRKRRHLFYSDRQQKHVVMLHCEPDPDKGAPNV